MELFEPGKMGNLTIKNRIVMAAMGNRLIELDGRLSQRAVDYYTTRAKGGVGLIITGSVFNRQIEKLPFTPLVDVPVVDYKVYGGRLSELAESVHDYGAKIALQLIVGSGRHIGAEILKSFGAVAPSALPAFTNPNIIARELTTEEIEQLSQACCVTAEIARSAGIDAIEVNCHGGYIVDEFLTSLWNKRGDRYGGSLDGRMRFLLAIIENVRKGAGKDCPVIVKFGLTHYLEGGREIEEGLEIARRLEVAGVDALDVDAGSYESIHWLIPPPTQPAGCLVDLAERVKKVVKIPVIAVGRLHYPELAEAVLQEGKADFIALGRGLLADPDWPNKVKTGNLDDICPCIGDLDGCRRRVHEGKSISCTVNPACGMEKELTLSPAVKKKTIVVVGGGPGGMEAARVAALRGHRVILYEKSNSLGGNLLTASVPSFKQDYLSLAKYLAAQIKKLGVEIKLGTEATPELIRKMKPDAVFIATGSTPLIPPIPGTDGGKAMTACELLAGNKPVKEPVVIVGGGSIGCETALHLARQGKKVTIVEMLDTVAPDMYSVNRDHLLRLLEDAGVPILTGTTVSKIDEKGVHTTNRTGRKSILPAGSVVLACGLRPDDKLYQAVQYDFSEIYAIGDCVVPRKVLNAIREGFRLARLV